MQMVFVISIAICQIIKFDDGKDWVDQIIILLLIQLCFLIKTGSYSKYDNGYFELSIGFIKIHTSSSCRCMYMQAGTCGVMYLQITFVK